MVLTINILLWNSNVALNPSRRVGKKISKKRISMNIGFEKIIEQEVLKALPTDCIIIPSHKLLGKPPYKVRFAFFSKKKNGYDVLINIIVLPASIVLDKSTELQIIQLRNYILSKKCMLIVIYENANRTDLPIFIAEDLNLSSPNYLSIEYDSQNKFKPMIRGLDTYYDYESIRDIIRDIWQGRLVYKGIKVGKQLANIEVMTEECFRCHKIRKVVTGIVFPNKKLHSWDNSDWKYFNQIVLIAELDDLDIAQIKPVVEQLRQEEPLITPIEYRFSKFIKSEYWAAVCPHCNVIKGNNYVEDERRFVAQKNYSRLCHDLEYFSFEMNVRQYLIEKIAGGWEEFPHTCMSGWYRRSDI